MLENIRPEIDAKIGVRVTMYRQLWMPVFLFSCSMKIGVNFAFVLTPKSAVKSSRRTERLFSTVTISLVEIATLLESKVLIKAKKKHKPFTHLSLGLNLLLKGKVYVHFQSPIIQNIFSLYFKISEFLP